MKSCYDHSQFFKVYYIKMSYNISEQLLDILRFNVAAYSVSISLVHFPVLVVILVSITAIMWSKNVQWKMKILMLYVVVPEAIVVVNYISTSFNFVFNIHGIEPALFCKITLYISSVCFDCKVSASFMYSLCVYIILRTQLSKLKWKFLVSMLMLSLAIALLSNIPTIPASSDNTDIPGDCIIDPTAVVFTKYFINLLVWCSLISLTVIFSILSFCYVKHNSLNDKMIQKGMIKSLLLFLVSGFTEIFILLIGPVYYIIFNKYSIWITVVVQTLLITTTSAVHVIPSLAIMYFVKPIRDTIKFFVPYCQEKIRNVRIALLFCGFL